MNDYVQVPREAIETILGYLTPFAPLVAREQLNNVLAAAPQATDPRERHILVTPDRSHVEVRDMDHAMTLLAEQNMAIDSLQSRIATLIAERDAAWRVLKKIAEYDWVPAYAIQALYHVQGLASRALSPPPLAPEKP